MKSDKKNLIKRLAIYALVIYVIISAIPAISYGVYKTYHETGTSKKNIESSEASNNTAESSASETESSDQDEIPDFLDGYSQTISSTDTDNKSNEETFKILDNSTGEVLTVAAADFLPAAVACEIPVTAPDEAIKAQAVATYTYYTWQKNNSTLENADFSCNTSDWSVYVTTEQLQEKWGDSYNEYYTKIKTLTDSVYGQLLMKDSSPICATYFSISNGSTETAANVWGGELSYLQTVASPGDVLNSAYLSTNSFTKDDLQEALSSNLSDESFDFSLPESEWFQNQSLSSAGYTNTIDVCGITLKGTQLRTALGLSSTCFEVSYENGSFTFTVKGRGHGVGMSQAGAIYMAQSGSSYEEILAHYYSGAELVK